MAIDENTFTRIHAAAPELKELLRDKRKEAVEYFPDDDSKREGYLQALDGLIEVLG